MGTLVTEMAHSSHCITRCPQDFSIPVSHTTAPAPPVSGNSDLRRPLVTSRDLSWPLVTHLSFHYAVNTSLANAPGDSLRVGWWVSLPVAALLSLLSLYHSDSPRIANWPGRRRRRRCLQHAAPAGPPPPCDVIGGQHVAPGVCGRRRPGEGRGAAWPARSHQMGGDDEMGDGELVAERLRPRGHHRLVTSFFPCNAHRVNAKISYSRRGGGARDPVTSPMNWGRGRTGCCRKDTRGTRRRDWDRTGPRIGEAGSAPAERSGLKSHEFFFRDGAETAVLRAAFSFTCSDNFSRLFGFFFLLQVISGWVTRSGSHPTFNKVCNRVTYTVADIDIWNFHRIWYINQ